MPGWAEDGTLAADIFGVCQDCGQLTRVPWAPELQGRYSEEEAVQAAIDARRGLPRPFALLPAPRRPGGFVHPHQHYRNAAGEEREDPVSGSICPTCQDAAQAESDRATGRTPTLRRLLHAYEAEHGHTPSTQQLQDQARRTLTPAEQAELTGLFTVQPETPQQARARGIRRKRAK